MNTTKVTGGKNNSVHVSCCCTKLKGTLLLVMGIYICLLHQLTNRTDSIHSFTQDLSQLWKFIPESCTCVSQAVFQDLFWRTGYDDGLFDRNHVRKFQHFTITVIIILKNYYNLNHWLSNQYFIYSQSHVIQNMQNWNISLTDIDTWVV